MTIRRDIGGANFAVHEALSIINLLFAVIQHEESKIASTANYSLAAAIDALDIAVEVLDELA